jgi:ubiquinol-cytochrome c reductase cytochrome b subunit
VTSRPAEAAVPRHRGVAARVADWFDDRLGLGRFTRGAVDKVFPDHWSFLLGEIAFYCFMVLLASGVYLTFFYEASPRDVVYAGSYPPLRGVHMSAAYQSTVRLSFDVRFGLFVRQLHHWAALVFLAAIVVHLCRIFFTGAFRRPRELNWTIGVTLFVLALFNGFSGYSLPDDLLSGTGLRIAYSVLLSIPVVGSRLAFLVFAGEFPGSEIISRLFILHVLVVPALIVVLLTIHLAVIWRQKHTQFPGPGRTEDNVVGSRLWPAYAARSIGLLVAVAAVLAALAGLVQINPVWLYGPFQPAAVTTAAQPDWYVGWLEGALRLAPPWRFTVFGWEVSEVFLPGIVLPGVLFAVLYLWPFLERRVTGDRREHHLLDRPRDRPVRTALGITALAFMGVLLAAGGQDIVARSTGWALVDVRTAFRIALFVVPIACGLVTWKLCHDLQGARPARPDPPAPIGYADPEDPALAEAVLHGGRHEGDLVGAASDSSSPWWVRDIIGLGLIAAALYLVRRLARW